MGIILDDDTPDTVARPTLAIERVAIALHMAEPRGQRSGVHTRAAVALNLGDAAVMTRAIERVALALAARHPVLRHFEVAHAVARDAVAALIADLSIVRKGR